MGKSLRLQSESSVSIPKQSMVMEPAMLEFTSASRDTRKASESRARMCFHSDFPENKPTDHHVDIFRLQSRQPLPPETNSLQVHQDPAGHLKTRHHLEKIFF